MKLKKEDLIKFKKLYKQRFNVELSDREALDIWLKLLNLVKNILLPKLEVKWK